MRRVGRSPVHPLEDLPTTFEETLPCTDCPGIDFHLNLREDGVYFLRETYQDREGRIRPLRAPSRSSPRCRAGLPRG
ncbi:copper resistance protein NlpE N-terminal domain-containing protein [Thioalkalivibrio nitratireducens]|uniref:copper resistance protein NlpE N-terminal domain-containing protein n=1 Tax=Thioalkalivibrio nitratireducens TaxID=186931 RepID=UPI0012EE38F4